MKNPKPPFEITNTIINSIIEIAELAGQLTSMDKLSNNPVLRRTNRIRTIHGSLAIEQNTLSLEQVTAVLNGRQGLALLCEAARDQGVVRLCDNIALDNPSVSLFLSMGFRERLRNEEYVLVERTL